MSLTAYKSHFLVSTLSNSSECILMCSHHTQVTVSPGHQTFTEATSCFAVAGISSRKCSHRTAGTRWNAVTIHEDNVCVRISRWKSYLVSHNVLSMCGSVVEISYPCSLQARRSAHNEPLCSARSALPPRWLCSGTDQQLDRLERLSCRHIFLHSESPADHSYRLQKQFIVRINRWNNSSGCNSCRQTVLPDEVSSDSEPLRESHVLSSLSLLALLFCHKLLQSKQHLSKKPEPQTRKPLCLLNRKGTCLREKQKC